MRFWAAVPLLLSMPLVMGAGIEQFTNQGPAYQPEFEEPQPWQEGQAAIPDYPLEENLVELAVDVAHHDYRHLLDRASLSVGEDGVVRYTLLLESKGGVRNVFFEGVNCATREYKRYAYGTSAGKMRAVHTPQWRFITDKGAGQFRYELYNFFLCQRGSPAGDAEQILKGIEHPVHRSTLY